MTQYFAESTPEVQRAASLASEGLRDGDYEKAVVSLQAIRNSEQLTLEQGLMVHNSMVALEAELIRAMEIGDKNAERAYETLRRMKRD